MLSEQDKREMLNDAFNEEKRKAFEEADKKAEAFIRRHRASLNADMVIKFLMDVQEVTGPFPVSKKVSTGSSSYRL